MSSTSFGKKATELVKEIASSVESSASPSSIPPYNDELVRSILEEVKAHYQENRSLAEKLKQVTGKEEQEGIKAAIQTHHHSILRNKKALMIPSRKESPVLKSNVSTRNII